MCIKIFDWKYLKVKDLQKIFIDWWTLKESELKIEKQSYIDSSGELAPDFGVTVFDALYTQIIL